MFRVETIRAQREERYETRKVSYNFVHYCTVRVRGREEDERTNATIDGRENETQKRR